MEKKVTPTEEKGKKKSPTEERTITESQFKKITSAIFSHRSETQCPRTDCNKKDSLILVEANFTQAKLACSNCDFVFYVPHLKST